MNPRALYIPAGNIFANLTITGNLFGANGQTIAGNASGAWTVTSNGTNQNVILVPSGTGSVVLPAGTAANPGAEFTGTTSGLFLAGTNGVGFSVNGAEKARFSPTNGNLLLGVTTDGTGLTQRPASTSTAGGDAHGTDTFWSRVAAGRMAITATGTIAQMDLVESSSTLTASFKSSAGVVTLVTQSANNLILAVNGSSALTLDTGLNATFAGLTRNFGGAAGAATTTTNFQKSVTAIANATATTVLTITIPNAAHSASVRVRLVGSLGAGGAIGANEATGTVAYDITVCRTGGVNAAALISAAFGSAMQNVAGAATITVTAALGAVVGAVGASNTIPVQVTITRGSGASANHTCQVAAEVVNANATGVTVS